jgi:TatD DNase family protein
MDVRFDDEHELPDVTQAMAAARAVNVTKVIQVGCDVASSQWAAQTALTHPDVWATVALHPNAAAHDTDLANSLAEIALLAQLPQVRAIGETGLDYYRTDKSQAQAQHESFRAHIDIARIVGKPVIIHDRDAHDDVIATLETHGAPDKVVFHCFSGDAQMAKICAQAGWYMSIPGVVTFKNAQQLRDAILEIPDHLLLVETDAPFLTPAPNRGQVNSSTNLPWSVRAICEVRGQSEQEICEILFSNAARVFGPF